MLYKLVFQALKVRKIELKKQQHYLDLNFKA